MTARSSFKRNLVREHHAPVGALRPYALRRALSRVRSGITAPLRCGAGRVVLHIRSGPAGGGLVESCGNAPALNAVEILPCAERAPLHMGARTLKTDVLGRTPESCGKPRIGSRGRRPPMCNAPAGRPGKNPAAPIGFVDDVSAGRAPPSGSPISPRPRESPSPPASPPASDRDDHEQLQDPECSGGQSGLGRRARVVALRTQPLRGPALVPWSMRSPGSL